MLCYVVLLVFCSSCSCCHKYDSGFSDKTRSEKRESRDRFCVSLLYALFSYADVNQYVNISARLTALLFSQKNSKNNRKAAKLAENFHHDFTWNQCQRIDDDFIVSHINIIKYMREFVRMQRRVGYCAQWHDRSLFDAVSRTLIGCKSRCVAALQPI